MGGWSGRFACVAAGVLLVATCWTGMAADREVKTRIARENLQKAGEALREKQLAEARAAAEKALEALGNAEDDEEEQRTLRLQALAIVYGATFFADKERWREAMCEALQINEQIGDKEQTAELVYRLALYDSQLTQEERSIAQALASYARRVP